LALLLPFTMQMINRSFLTLMCCHFSSILLKQTLNPFALIVHIMLSSRTSLNHGSS
jgi:hypothetical protein